MNAQTKAMEATPRPWLQTNIHPECILGKGQLSRDSFCIVSNSLDTEYGRAKSRANAALIVEAVNLFDALQAVAEAAGMMLDRMKSEESRFPKLEKENRQRFINRMEKSLSQLAAIRKETP